MSKTFISADYHLGEDRFELMGRPFTDPMSHDHKLVFEHNQLVNEEDTVIFNGDVCYQKAPEYLKYVKWFNGKKILVRGNHDRVFTDEELKPYFNEIVEEGSGFDFDVKRADGSIIPCYITHYPTRGVKTAFNLVGHIHAAWKYQLNMFNVGVDVNHFRPVNMDKIEFHYDAVCKFYDDDVWVGYNDINAQFKGVRGKKGSYFNPNKG
jgi:calcineurin-like phosphoesterase family protein